MKDYGSTYKLGLPLEESHCKKQSQIKRVDARGDVLTTLYPCKHPLPMPMPAWTCKTAQQCGMVPENIANDDEPLLGHIDC
jgi:hypothetical protein